MNQEMSLNKIASILKKGASFLLVTHKDPDPDGIGSMLALGRSLLDAKKKAVFLTEEPISAPFTLLKGGDRIVQDIEAGDEFDAVVALDCGDRARVGASDIDLDDNGPLINIDHHGTNDFFGDINLVDAGSSSTGELIFRVIKKAGFPMGPDVAENIFTAIQMDTGSFRYENTTPECLKIAGEMLGYGVKPWELYRKFIDVHSHARLRLLGMGLGSIEYHYMGKIGIMTLSSEMFKRAGAKQADSEKFVDYPRFVSGVEIAVLIREKKKNVYKLSLRSNGEADVASLASRFGGGGHAKAAGFDYHGHIEDLKKDFLKEAVGLLDEAPC